MTSIKLKDFITKIIRFNNIDEILEQHDDYSLKGFMYERLWDLVIKFGFCDEFPKSKYTHMIGNVNNGNIKPLTSIANYVEKNKVCSGNSDRDAFDFLPDVRNIPKTKLPIVSDDSLYKLLNLSHDEIKSIL